MQDGFYKAFEEKYRGSRALIKSRLQVYLPFIQPIFKVYPHHQALDLGCGRGEWLEILTELGFNAKGVDLDDGMLKDCRERDFQVEISDALAYIQTIPEESVCIVSGFHIAEHLPFNVLKQLVQEAKRVLLPGGLLILETPNPENISVGTNRFYLDPTHDKPIPPDLLSFLPKYYGYSRVKVIRLQEAELLRVESNPRLINVIDGVSPDYAIVAQTQGVPLLMEALSSAFEQELGLTLQTLAERYQESLNQRLTFLEAQAKQSNERAASAEAQAKQSNERAASAEAQAKQSSERAASVEAKLKQSITKLLKAYLNQLIIWPKFLSRLFRKLGSSARLKAIVKKVLRKFGPTVMARPKLKAWAKCIVYGIGLGERIKPFVLTNHQHLASLQQNNLLGHMELVHLSPRARQIYTDLKIAIAQKPKGGH